ncbi:vomeronasal type-2 receptor 26-like [Podarcis lilfordi]|uniref:Vomeronasal type-2 receptor 26-like n=1 Tax=Podarcis lilfordi TaxID=74358 RepID=A0AA35L739_9SAUR|nr:vomeronasal type-2 receptor 26-like [Podarcis lilfordi]
MTYQNTLNVLFNLKKTIPNYSCDTEKNLIAVIGGLDSETSLHMANFLSIYKIPQVTYCFFAALMNEKTEFPFVYQMVPNEAQQYNGIVHLFLHFQWKWIGIIALDDEKGDRFVQNLLPLLSQNGMCSAFIDRLPFVTSTDNMIEIFYLSRPRESMALFLTNTKVNVFVLNADTFTILMLKWFLYLAQTEDLTEAVMGKVWVMTAQWEFSSHIYYRNLDIDFFHGALSFTLNSNEVFGFQNFLQVLNFHWPKGDGFIRVFWEQAFGCLWPGTKLGKELIDICTGEEKLESLPGIFFEMSMTAQSYSIYNAVHAIAQALHARYSAIENHRTVTGDRGSLEPPHQQPWQVTACIS